MPNKYISGTLAADGETAGIVIVEKGLAFVGGAGGADFGSGTVTVQAKGPDGQWYDTQETFSASDVKSLSFNLPTEVRLSLSGSTDPDIDYAIQSDMGSYRD